MDKAFDYWTLLSFCSILILNQHKPQKPTLGECLEMLICKTSSHSVANVIDLQEQFK